MSADRYKTPAALPAHLSKVPCPAPKLVRHPAHESIVLQKDCESVCVCVSDPLPIPLPRPFFSPHRSRARDRGFALSLRERACLILMFFMSPLVSIFLCQFFRVYVMLMVVRNANGVPSGFCQWFALRPGLKCSANFNGVPSSLWYALELGLGHVFVSLQWCALKLIFRPQAGVRVFLKLQWCALKPTLCPRTMGVGPNMSPVVLSCLPSSGCSSCVSPCCRSSAATTPPSPSLACASSCLST